MKHRIATFASLLVISVLIAAPAVITSACSSGTDTLTVESSDGAEPKASSERRSDTTAPEREPSFLEPAGAASYEGDARSDSPPTSEDSKTLPPLELSAAGPGAQQESHLKAGETDDNENWDQYLEYIRTYEGPPVRPTNLKHRRIITVKDTHGRPVPGALVSIKDGDETLFDAITYSDGRTIFFPETQVDQGKLTVTAEKDQEVSPPTSELQGSSWEIQLDVPRGQAPVTNLDVLFLLDSTGSMEDEIDRIKATLVSIADQVSNLPLKPDLRFAMVSYRDRGDDYVTRLFDFEPDPEVFAQTIRRVRAEGGDDYPEALNEALSSAIKDPAWRTQDTVRLIFLIADAPPHLDYPQDADYSKLMIEAKNRGIKIFSVASSGLDLQGEYIFRQLAQQTMGKFIFILYESDQGSLETPHGVGDQYTVHSLDKLIVRLIQEQLAPLSTAGPAEQQP